MRLLICIFLLILTFAGSGQQLPPDSILKASNAIVMYDDTEFTIKNIKESVLKRKYKILILKKYADDKKDIVLHYNQFTQIKEANVIHSDARGSVVKKYKLKDFQDKSAGGGDVASDSRVKLLRIDYDHYPFLLEVSYEVQNSRSLFYPVWMPQDEEKLYISSATLKIIDHESSGVRYRSYNLPEPSVTENKGKVYSWEVKDLNAFEYEYFSSGFKDFMPIVYTAPNKFEMDGYAGDMSSWKSFGQWINKLNEGKNNLSEQHLSDVKQLVSDAPDDLEKTRRIYEYLQNNSRYVSIQLGIGGWQPFDAAFVHEKKYGDCKALSFYTKSLLEAVGVKAYYTLIRAGAYQPQIEEDFPNAHFNHAILTVPVQNDTVWLECTSQTNPFGYMGMSTSGRKALLVAEDGGHIIQTKEYTAEDNEQNTTGIITLNKNGSASASVTRMYRGIEIGNDNFQYMLLKPKSDQDMWFYDELEWGSFTIKDYSLTPILENTVPEAGFSAEVEFKNAGIFSSNRLFFKPAIFTDINYIKLNQEKRKKDIFIRYPYRQADSVLIIPPSGFHIEKNLNDEELDSPYGSYSRQIIEDKDGQFLYIRKFVLKKGLFPAEEYSDFRDFIKNIQKLDRQKLVFLNRT